MAAHISNGGFLHPFERIPSHPMCSMPAMSTNADSLVKDKKDIPSHKDLTYSNKVYNNSRRTHNGTKNNL
ncbi:MAG: hypothetical protein ACI8V2_004021 [Candidatus Latescibacterota bacterium]|jgi:hypothetical protein